MLAASSTPDRQEHRFYSRCESCGATDGVRLQPWSTHVPSSQANVVAPNKHSAAYEAKYRGHLLESETYIGGKVEALESGVFRSDLPCRFKLQPGAYQASMCRSS